MFMVSYVCIYEFIAFTHVPPMCYTCVYSEISILICTYMYYPWKDILMCMYAVNSVSTYMQIYTYMQISPDVVVPTYTPRIWKTEIVGSKIPRSSLAI